MTESKFTVEEITEQRLIKLPRVTWEGMLKDYKSIDIATEGMGGVYTLHLEGELIYVGVSIKPRNRLAHHYSIKDTQDVGGKLNREYGEDVALDLRDKIKVELRAIEDVANANLLESYLISVRRPKYNVETRGTRGGGRPKTLKEVLEDNKELIIQEYTENGLSVRGISQKYGYNHTDTYHKLREWGVDTGINRTKQTATSGGSTESAVRDFLENTNNIINGQPY